LEKNCIPRKDGVDISVIIPIYNVEDFLPACLDSVARQTKDNLEVIMLDDGATDSSGKIADDYAEKYDHFYCLHIENGGLGHARNYAAQYANGKYIVFLDSDDIVTPDAYEKMFCMAEKYDADMAICNVCRFNSAKEWQSDLHNRAFRNAASVTHITENHDLLYDTTSWNKLIRRSFWEENGFQFPENILYEDIPVTIPMHFRANRVAVVHSVGYLWRVRDNASKSITQNASDLKNLQDRITIVKMLDAFLRENVKDESLLLDAQIKTLEIDLMIFVNNCVNKTPEQAQETIRILQEYLAENISEEALAHIAPIRRHLMQCVREGDFEKILRLLLYKKDEYYFNPVTEEDGALYLTLSEELFGCKRERFDEEISGYSPRVYINKIRAEEGCLNLDAHLYFNRLNLPNFEAQQVEAFLCNEFEGSLQPLEVVPYENTDLTATKGKVYNKFSGEGADYNYNGTGFTVKINLSDLSFDGDSRNNVVLLRYHNRYVKGITTLRNMSHGNEIWADNLSVLFKNTVARLSVGAMKTLLVSTETVDCFMTGHECQEDTLEITVTGKNASLFAVNTQDENDRFDLTDCGEGVFRAPVAALTDEHEYALFAKTAGGVHPLVREKKSAGTLHSPAYALLIRSNKTHNVILRKLTATSYIKNVTCENNIISFETISAGALRTEDSAFAKVGVRDEITEQTVYFATAECKVKNGRAKCAFSIDFNDEVLKKDLYHSRL